MIRSPGGATIARTLRLFPDGSQIAFAGRQDGAYDIFLFRMGLTVPVPARKEPS